jgi:hypothetical protein
MLPEFESNLQNVFAFQVAEGLAIRILERLTEMLAYGKQGLVAMVLDFGRRLAMAIIEAERVEIVGSEHHPHNLSIRRWAS